MIVAINISATKSGHRFRGIGFYTQNLVENLKSLQSESFRVVLFDGVRPPDEVDLVHLPYFDLFKPTLKLGNFKTVVTVHDVIPLLFPAHYPPGAKGKLWHQLQKRSLLKTSAVICDSQASKKDIVKHLKYPREKTSVVYLAAPDIFKPVKSSMILRSIIEKYQFPKKFVLYVGDVNYHKNVIGLIKAAKKVGLPVVIVGKKAASTDFDSSHIENRPLVEIIKEYGDDSEVMRLGFVPDEDLVAIFNLAMVYCQPSFYEGFGLPVLQAMACGTPVVAAKTGSLPEICGESAMMVDPNSVNSLAAGLKKLSTDTRAHRKYVRLGLTQAKKFSWQKTARQTLTIYQKVISEK